MIRKLLLACFLFYTLSGFSQQVKLSVYSEISIVTSGPGNNLYEKFGHTAIRVKDPVLNLDLLYNYGIFDFNDSDFYVSFIKGFMKYKLIRYPFHLSLKSAGEERRWMKQQVLNLTQKQKSAFFYFLENNAKPENARYYYDPFFNNCATKPRDIVKEIVRNILFLSDTVLKNPKSIRALMNEKIHPNTWGSFGINIALGSRLDKVASAEEYMYLPEYLFLIFEESKIKKDTTHINLVKKTEDILSFESKPPVSNHVNPFLLFSVLFLLVTGITYFDYKNNTRTKIVDFLIFGSTGLVGLLIVFLWFFTNHSTAPYNFNFLWAFAPNFFIAFFLLKNKTKRWFKKYLLLLSGLLILILLFSVFNIQKFTYPLFPLLLLLFIRYLFLLKR